MTLLVRDEDDCIRNNIDFHLSQGVDFIIAMDNKSTDRTSDILKEYENQGVLKYILETDDDYEQHRWVTRMARMAYSDYGADWVINNDADEFWWPVDGNLKTTLLRVPENQNVIVVNRHNFAPVERNNAAFYKDMIYREKTSLNALGQPLPPKVAHRAYEQIVVGQGNHQVENIQQVKNTQNIIQILHFPIRSYSQFENKIVKGGAAYENNQSLPKSIGRTWRKLYSEYKAEGSLLRYYQAQFYNMNRLHQNLDNGCLVKDLRLMNYLNKIYQPGPTKSFT